MLITCSRMVVVSAAFAVVFVFRVWVCLAKTLTRRIHSPSQGTCTEFFPSAQQHREQIRNAFTKHMKKYVSSEMKRHSRIVNPL